MRNSRNLQKRKKKVSSRTDLGDIGVYNTEKLLPQSMIDLSHVGVLNMELTKTMTYLGDNRV